MRSDKTVEKVADLQFEVDRGILSGSKPRGVFNRPHASVTNLEMRTGSVRGMHEKHAAAVLYFALGEFEPERKCDAYELPASDAIGFYENIGFKRTGNEPPDQIGTVTVSTVHLEAPHAGMVREQLQQQYPWIDVASS